MNPGVLYAVTVASAVMVVGIAVLALVGRRAFQSLIVKAGPVSVELSAVERLHERVEHVARTADAINNAVNDVNPSEPKLRETVERLGQLSDWQCKALHVLARASGVELSPTPPDWRTTTAAMIQGTAR